MTTPCDFQLGEWYSKYLPSEDDVAWNKAKGMSEDCAAWEAGRYSNHVRRMHWQLVAMTWARKVIRNRGPVFKLILIGVSNGRMAAFEVCKAHLNLKPGIWLASCPSASFQLAVGDHLRTPAGLSFLQAGRKSTYWGFFMGS